MDFVNRNVLATKTEHLFQERLAIAHGSRRASCDQFERVLVGLRSLVGADEFQPSEDLIGMDRWKIVTLATGQDGDRNFIWIGRAEDKLDVPWGLFKRLEQRVECLRCKHVNFVDNVDLVRRASRTDRCVRTQLANLIDPAIACTVDFNHVHVIARIDRQGDLGLRIEVPFSVGRCIESFGENPSGTGLTHPPCSGKKVSMSDPMGLDRP